MSTIQTISEAVYNALVGATFSLPVVVDRGYLVVRPLEEITDIKATIVPSFLAVSALDMRPRLRHEWTVAVWLQKRTEADAAAIDPLMQLVEDVVGLFAFRPLAGTAAQCVGAEARPAPDPDALDDDGLFLAAVNLTFRLNP